MFDNLFMLPFRLVANLAVKTTGLGLTIGWLAFLTGTGLGLGLLVLGVLAETNGAEIGEEFFLWPWWVIVEYRPVLWPA